MYFENFQPLPMETYLNLLRHILKNGNKREDRTGTGTLSVFGYQMRFSLSPKFPLITTKKIFFRSVIFENLWFLRGEEHIKFLQENKVKIWNPWADKNGNLGPVYGVQWRKWKDYQGGHIDQIRTVIENIKKNPASRRHIVSAWNVADLPKMALPPCHVLFQFYVHNDKLSCQLYQRSADAFIGLPFNIAGYALLTYMIAHVCNLQPDELIISLGDAHIYLNHLEQVKEQLSRTPKELPELVLNPEVKNIDDFTYEDFTLRGYDPHPHIKAPIAV